jgi:hypothetical protein
MNEKSETPIVIYEGTDKSVEVRLDADRDTVWLTQRQMSELFGKDVRTVNEHVQNVFSEGELEREATIREFRIVRQEGARQVSRAIEHYNLDVIISVGYRVKSHQGTRFRQWATRTLRDHLTRGWTLNRQRFETNARELEAAMVLVRKAAQSPALDTSSGRGLVDIVARYAQTFLLLQRYDEGLLTEPPVQPGGRLPSVKEARAALDNLKAELMARGEATDLFARDRGDGLASLMGNLDQSVFGEPAYRRAGARADGQRWLTRRAYPGQWLQRTRRGRHQGRRRHTRLSPDQGHSRCLEGDGHVGR